MTSSSPPPPTEEPRETPRSELSFLQAMRAVAWSFLGIRRSSGLVEDAKKVSLLHVVLAGVLGAVLFVLLLVTLVHYVVSSGAAK